MDRPTISSTDAVFQAGTTVETYLNQAVCMLENKFGEAYVKAHPALIVECIRAQTMDFNMAALVAVLYEIKDALDGLGGEGKAIDE